MPARHAIARPCRIRQFSPAVGCDALTVHGYRADDGHRWRGPFRRSYRDAVRDAQLRNQLQRKDAANV